MVEHVSAGEEKDGNQADGSPEVAVLQNGHHIWRGNSDEGNGSENSSDGGDDLNIVDWTDKRRVRPGWKVTGDPGVYGVGGRDAVEKSERAVE